MPASRSARATTFTPRSCPSRPTFASSTLMGSSDMRGSSFSLLRSVVVSVQQLVEAPDVLLHGARGRVAVAAGDSRGGRVVVGRDPGARGGPVAHLAERLPHPVGDRLAQGLREQRRERVARGAGQLDVEARVELEEAVAVLDALHGRGELLQAL